MAGALLTFVIHTFSLNGTKETSDNLYHQISTAISTAFYKIGVEEKQVLGFCDSLHVMTLTRNIFSGEVDSGSSCVVFVFGYCSNALSNLPKNVCAV